jgi:hypothetical protein
MTPNVAARNADSPDMERDLFPIKAVGCMLLGFVGIGLAGLAVVGMIQPGAIRGFLRFLSLAVISAGFVAGTMWAGVVAGLVIQWRVQESD